MAQKSAMLRWAVRKWVVVAAALAFAGTIGALALASPRDADANELTSALTQVSPTSWRLTAPSGFATTISGADITEAGVSGQSVATSARDLAWATQSPRVPGGTNGVGVGLAGSSVYSYPLAWSGDQLWHPATRITIQFDHPVVSPSLPISTYAIGALHTFNGTKTGDGVTAMRLRFTGASGAAGAVPIAVAAKAGFNTSLYDVSGNAITPRLQGGQMPYLGAENMFCDPATPTPNDQNASPWINDRFPGTMFIAGPCGSVGIDTGGVAVTQLTVEQDFSYAAAATELPNGTWNGAGLTQVVFGSSLPTEVSGSLTPSGLGAATHIVSTLAIGGPGDSPTISPAFATVNLTSPTAGTPSDNSDDGYTPEANLVHAPLTNHSTGTFTIQVPYTGLSQDAYLNGWIDFNLNDSWDPGESAVSVVAISHTGGATQSGTATLSFAIPSGGLTPTSSMWLRLRIAYDSADVASPSSMARSGEVEDHELVVQDTTPDVAVSKSASVVGGGTAVVNSVIEYQVRVENQSSAVPADDITITDQIPAGIDIDLTHAGTTPGLSVSGGVLSSTPFDLGPGESTTITYFGVATEVGTQTNSVVADTPLGCQTTDAAGDPCSSSTDTDIQPAGQLQLEKSTQGLADDAVLSLGQQVTYRFTVTNATPDPVTNIALDDPMLGQSMCQLTVTSLAAGDSAWCEVTYTVTQADIDARRIVNTATVSGDGPGGTPIPGDDSSKTNDTDAKDGALEIEKTASLPGGATAAKEGDTITYRITATNTSGFTMSDVTLSDDNVADLSCTLGGSAVSFPLDALAPGAQLECAATHLVTADDAEAGHVANVATGEANLPPDPDTPDTPVPADVAPGHDDVPVGGLEVVKQAFDGDTEITDQPVALGQVVTYRITVSNTSAYPVTTLQITDPMLRDANVTLSCVPSLPVTLLHGERIVCSGDYTVTQADVDRGHVANEATASGQWPVDPDFPGMPVGPVPPASDSTDTPTVYPSGGSLEVAKTAVIHDPTSGATKQTAVAGDTIVYTITAHNTTGLTMSQVALDDSLLPALGTGASTCSIDRPPTANVSLPATLAPGATLTCLAMYQVTADDAAAGKVVNVVTGSGDVPGQWDPADPGTTPPPVPITPGPASNTQPVGGLVVTKTASTSSSPVRSGDTVDYTVRIANTSAFPMVDVVMTDTLAALGRLTLTCVPAGSDPLSGIDLAPLSAVTCTGQYTVTPADIAAGAIANTATASGQWGPVPPDWAGPDFPSGPVGPASDTVVTPVTPGSSPTPTPSPSGPGSGVSGNTAGRGTQGGELGFTGAQVGGILGLAVLFLAAGSAFVWWKRRRPGREEL